MNEGALAPAVGTHVPAGGEPPRRSSGRQGLVARLWRSERGTAVVEFALVAPLLFLLVFGIVEFGRALNYYNDLTQLAGQGARAAGVSVSPDGTPVATDGRCTTPATNNSIQCQIAKTYPSDGELRDGISVCLGSLNTTTNTIGALPATVQVGDPVTVRTKFRFNFDVGFFGIAGITLSSTQTERLEQPPSWSAGNTAGPSGGNACSP